MIYRAQLTNTALHLIVTYEVSVTFSSPQIRKQGAQWLNTKVTGDMQAAWSKADFTLFGPTAEAPLHPTAGFLERTPR